MQDNLAVHVARAVGSPGSAVLIFVPGMASILSLMDSFETLKSTDVEYKVRAALPLLLQTTFPAENVSVHGSRMRWRDIDCIRTALFRSCQRHRSSLLGNHGQASPRMSSAKRYSYEPSSPGIEGSRLSLRSPIVLSLVYSRKQKDDTGLFQHVLRLRPKGFD